MTSLSEASVCAEYGRSRWNLGATVLSFKIFLVCYLLFLAVPVQAGVTEPDPRTGDAFDFMNVLAKKGLHDLKDERWNAYGQFTYISSWKGAFPALYTNLNGSPNSLLPGSERSFAGTATLYLGLKPWHGGEIYFAPEMISMRPLSDLKGLGGDTKLRIAKGRLRNAHLLSIPIIFQANLGIWWRSHTTRL